MIALFERIKENRIISIILATFGALGLTAALFDTVSTRLSDVYTDYFNYVPQTGEENPFPVGITFLPYAKYEYCLGLSKDWAKENDISLIEENDEYLKMKRGSQYLSLRCVKYNGEDSAYVIFSSKYSKEDKNGLNFPQRMANSLLDFTRNELANQNWFEKKSINAVDESGVVTAYSFLYPISAAEKISLIKSRSYPASIISYLRSGGFEVIDGNCNQLICVFGKPSVELYISFSEDDYYINPNKFSSSTEDNLDLQDEINFKQRLVRATVFVNTSPYSTTDMHEMYQFLRQIPSATDVLRLGRPMG